MQIKDSVVIVTGANRGLGQNFVQALLAGGARKVYAAARRPESIVMSGAIPIQLDVTNAADIRRVASELADVTLLINNAGIALGSNILDADSAEKTKAELEVNLFGPLAMSQAFAPTLAKNGGGAIVNILSILSWLNIPGWATYSISKAATWSMTNGLRNELRQQNTQVVGVHIAYMDTDMTKGVTAPKADPKDVVRQTLEAIVANKDEVFADALTAQVRQGLSNSVYLGAPGA